jgi:hypothetical protein
VIERVYDREVFEELRAAVSALRIPADGAALAEVFALRDLLDARLCEAVGEYDAARLWDLDAATSMTAWLRDRAGLSSRDAARIAARGRKLESLPVTTSAWQDGSLTGGQVEAVLACVSSAHVERWEAHEAAVVPALVGLSVDDTARAMRHWRARADASTDAPADDGEPEREVHVSMLLDGRRRLDGDLDPLGGEVVATALRLAETRDGDGDPVRTPGRRRADALVDLARFFLDHQTQRPGGRHRPHLNVVVDLDALEMRGSGEFVGGGLLDRASLQALRCDSAMHRVLTSRSTILDYGTATRTIPAPLWNVTVLRDRHCRWPGCDRPAHWCDGHHVVHVGDGGTTDTANIVLLCSRHHHRLHQHGWHAKLLPDATFHVTDPTGRVRTSHPAHHVLRL